MTTFFRFSSLNEVAVLTPPGSLGFAFTDEMTSASYLESSFLHRFRGGVCVFYL